MRDRDHGDSDGEHDVGPDACALDDALAVHSFQIVGHLLRKGALVLDVVTVDEHGHDERGEDQAGLERPGAVYIGAESHEGEIDEGQYRAGREYPGGRAPRPLLPRAVQTVNPARVQVQEVEYEIADI